MIHNFAGFAFPVELGRELARRGHPGDGIRGQSAAGARLDEAA